MIALQEKPRIEIAGYFADKDNRLTDQDAAIVGPELTRLAEMGASTANDIVEAARCDQSPLHKYFEWDDSRAADFYRGQQARRLVQKIKVAILLPDRDEHVEVRAFYPIRIEGVTPPGPLAQKQYQPIQLIVGDADRQAQVIKEAWSSLHAWRTRFAQYRAVFSDFDSEFAHIFEAIDTAQVVSEVA